MTKKQSFADKARKQQMIKGAICPVCGEAMQNIKMISPETVEGEGVKFREKLVRICKCNREQVLA